MEKTSLFGDYPRTHSITGKLHDFDKISKLNGRMYVCFFDVMGDDGELYPFSTYEGTRFTGFQLNWTKEQLSDRIVIDGFTDTSEPETLKLGISGLPIILQSGALWLDHDALSKTVMDTQEDYITGVYTWEAFKLYFHTNTKTGYTSYSDVPFEA